MTNGKIDSSDAIKRVVLTSAPPPWHSIAIYFMLLALWTSLLPTWEALDELATMETFTHRVFPELLSIKALAYIRLSLAAIVWVTTIDFYLSNNVDVMTVYLPGSKLHPTILQLRGIRTQFPFTSVAWNILGLSFTLAGYIALQAADDKDVGVWTLRCAIICWAIAAPFTMLVAVVVRYALWPKVLEDGGTTENLSSYRALLQHNANVMMALTEQALLGGLPVRWELVSFINLLGCAYTLFLWNVNCSWGIDVTKHGPQFLYFFYDTTLPGFFPSGALLTLIAVLLVFYGLFVSTGSILNMLPGGLVTHVLFVLVVSSAVMRFRD